MDKRVFNLLKNWCDTLLTMQIKELPQTEFNGGILCPACGMLHGRIGDLVYPFTYLWTVTDEEKYLSAAEDCVNWMETNMANRNGVWQNDFNNNWIGISAFFASSLYEAVKTAGDKLPENIKSHWLSLFFKVCSVMPPLFKKDWFDPAINYYAELMLNLAQAYDLTGDEKYISEMKWAKDFCLNNITDDGFLYGESGYPTASFKTKKGYRAIDIGYNIEESIPAIIMTGQLIKDKELENIGRSLMKTALEFMLPDGGIDNSAGSRSAKWTYYGSRTSDGMQCGLVLCPDEPMFIEAAYRNFLIMEKQTVNGLLSGGAMYGIAGEPVCIHHSFSHAKALTAMCRSGIDFSHKTSLPQDKVYGLKRFKSMGTNLISLEHIKACVSESDNDTSRGLVPVGGTLTMLYHTELGAVLVGTQNTELLIEPKNMQMRKDGGQTYCMTPRIEKNGCEEIFGYRHTYDKDFEFFADEANLSFTAKGTLTNIDGKKAENGGYSVNYTISDDGVTFTAETEDDSVFVLPVISLPDDSITVAGNTAEIKRGEHTIRIESTANIDLFDDGEGKEKRRINFCGGFLYIIFEIKLPKHTSEKIKLTVLP